MSGAVIMLSYIVSGIGLVILVAELALLAYIGAQMFKDMLKDESNTKKLGNENRRES